MIDTIKGLFVDSSALVIMGWVIVPFLTVVGTYFQQQKNQKLLDLAIIKRDKIRNFRNLLNNLLEYATDYWMKPEGHPEVARLAMNIKRTQKELEPYFEDRNNTYFTSLKMQVSGGKFEDSNREALDQTHEKFREIHSLVEKLKSEELD